MSMLSPRKAQGQLLGCRLAGKEALAGSPVETGPAGRPCPFPTAPEGLQSLWFLWGAGVLWGSHRTPEAGRGPEEKTPWSCCAPAPHQGALQTRSPDSAARAWPRMLYRPLPLGQTPSLVSGSSQPRKQDMGTDAWVASDHTVPSGPTGQERAGWATWVGRHGAGSPLPALRGRPLGRWGPSFQEVLGDPERKASQERVGGAATPMPAATRPEQPVPLFPAGQSRGTSPVLHSPGGTHRGAFRARGTLDEHALRRQRVRPYTTLGVQASGCPTPPPPPGPPPLNPLPLPLTSRTPTSPDPPPPHSPPPRPGHFSHPQWRRPPQST